MSGAARPCASETARIETGSSALTRIPVSVVVERRKAKSPWLDVLWRPILVLAGSCSTAPWTPISVAADTTLFYAGEAVIELHRTETANYRDNLASGAPVLWVVLRLRASGSACDLLAVTADPAEGEALTATGCDLVETAPMPPAIARTIADFIAEHHVERPFVKRQREGTMPRASAWPQDSWDDQK